MKRWLSLYLVAAALLPLLTACARTEAPPEEGGEGLALRVCATAAQRSVDPVAASQTGGDTIIFHLYENLMRWEDDGAGHAVLAPGVAESYETEEHYDGSVTYTFTLRRDAKWSDGKAVTAKHFLYAWRRLFEMENPPSAVSKLYMVEGYFDAKREKNGALLTGVSAPDQHTLSITITGHYAYFLDEFCAGAMTMPVREDAVKKYGGAWGQNASAVISNGPYRLRSIDGDSITLERSSHYDRPVSGPDEITFLWQESTRQDGGALAYSQLEKGELDFLAGLPRSLVDLRSQEGTLEVEPVPSTYALLMNSAAAPFDNEFVRRAFAHVVDPAAVTAAAADPTLHAATGFVPHGVANRDNQWVAADKKDAEEPGIVLPEDLINGAGAEPEEEPYWDYRAVGDYGRLEEDRSASLAEAKLLLSQGGYPNGQDFPAVEYLYVDTPQNAAVAAYLQQLWRTALNVEVTLLGVDQEEARSLLLAGEYAMAAFRFDPAFDDALAFLQRWQGKFGPKEGNLVSYADRAYDLLLSVVSASSDSAREACLHDAEELLLSAKSVVPLYYYGTTSALGEGLTGVYRKAGGVYFFDGVSRVEEELEEDV